MREFLITLAGCAAILAVNAAAAPAPAIRPVNPVVQWNRNLLSIVRTSGAQPATIHPTRSFAMMHAAISDAVNGHRPNKPAVSGKPQRRLA